MFDSILDLIGSKIQLK